MNFEEFLEESSRAQPADLEVWEKWRVSTRMTVEGDAVASGVRNGKKKYEVCFFSGNFVKGFEKLLNSSPGIAVLLSETFLEPPPEELDQDTVPLEKQIMKTYKCGETLLFVLSDLHFCILQSSLGSSDELKLYLSSATMVYAFIYESIAEFRSPFGAGFQKLTFFVPNSYCDSSLSTATRIPPLPMPNVLGKAGAVVLTYCEGNKLPCIVVVHYSELTDVSSNLLPFAEFINSSAGLRRTFKMFPRLFHFSKSENTILSSNLFV